MPTAPGPTQTNDETRPVTTSPTPAPGTAPAALSEGAAEHASRELLRLATAGSVDDGKSTLIGRLLYDTKSVLADQLSAVERATAARGAAPGGGGRAQPTPPPPAPPPPPRPPAAGAPPAPRPPPAPHGRIRRAVRRGHRRFAARRGLGGGRRGSGRLQHHHHITFGQLVVELDLDFLDHAIGGGRHFQRGLVRFQRDQPLVLLHRIAHGHQDLDHRHAVVVTDVRHLHLDRTRRRRRTHRRRGGRDRLLHGCGSRRRCRRSGNRSRCSGRAFGFQDHDHITLGQLVVELDLDLLDHAGCRGRHLQRRLVRFQRDQPLVLLHRVAHGHQDLDHRHAVVIADVRNLDFNRRHCLLPWAQSASWP